MHLIQNILFRHNAGAIVYSKGEMRGKEDIFLDALFCIICIWITDFTITFVHLPAELAWKFFGLNSSAILKRMCGFKSWGCYFHGFVQILSISGPIYLLGNSVLIFVQFSNHFLDWGKFSNRFLSRRNVYYSWNFVMKKKVVMQPKEDMMGWTFSCVLLSILQCRVPAFQFFFSEGTNYWTIRNWYKTHKPN